MIRLETLILMYLEGTFSLKKTASLAFVLFSALAFAAPNYDALFNASVGGQTVFGSIIKDPSIYTRNENKLFTPASNLKILTAYTALKKWGPDYRFKTSLFFRESDSSASIITDLVFEGAGDPTIGMSEFNEDVMTRVRAYAKMLKERGVSEVRGPITIASKDSRFSEIKRPQGWKKEWAIDCMGALGQSFNIWANCGTFVIKGANQGGWVEPGVTVPVKLNLRIGSTNSVQIKAIDTPTVDSAQYEMTGTIKAGAKLQAFLPIHDTANWAKRLLSIALQEQGIVVNATALKSSRAIQSIETYSPKLSEILKPFMKMSMNFIGEILIRDLGADFGPETGKLEAAGIQVILDTISDVTKVTVGTALYDGCGLSYDNRITPTVIFDVLKKLRDESFFKEFFDSLPIAGVDGTLEDRMKKTVAAGALFAKTGTLATASSMSGYVPRKAVGGQVLEYVPFVILSDTTHSGTSASRAVQDNVGVALVKDVNGLR